MDKDIHFDKHAYLRMICRALEFGLDVFDFESRIQETLTYERKPIRKHISNKYETRCLYFSDNLSIYVIFKERREAISVKTIIIEEGRE